MARAPQPNDPRPDGQPAPPAAPDLTPQPTSGGVVDPSQLQGWDSFYAQILEAIGAPLTQQNLNFFRAWQNRETPTGIGWNPFGTTVRVGNSKPDASNPVVQDYASEQDGITAVVHTLTNGLYSDLVSAFRSGTADVNAHYSGLSTWSGKAYDSLAGTPTSEPGGSPDNAAGTAGGDNSGSSAGNPAETAQLSADQIEQGLSADGFVLGLIDSVPELKRVFTEAMTKNATVQDVLVKLENTHWYREHNAAQRKYLQLQSTDPGQATRMLQQAEHDISQLSTQLGVPIDQKTLQQIAKSAVFNGLDNTEITQSLVGYFKYQGKSLVGQSGADVDTLKKMAQQYYVNLSDGQLQDMTQRMLIGQLQPQDLQSYFKGLALSKFPYLAQQLDQGLTVKDVADPYINEMANLLEKPANGISPTDPMVMKALQQSTPQGVQLMPLYQFSQMVKQSPEWLKTNNARDSMMDVTTNLLRDMGLIAGGVSVGNNMGSNAGVTSQNPSVGSVSGA